MEGEDYTVQEAAGGPSSHNTAPQRPVEGFRGRSRAAPGCCPPPGPLPLLRCLGRFAALAVRIADYPLGTLYGACCIHVG